MKIDLLRIEKEGTFKDYQLEDDSPYLSFKSVNFFIGANNSGKSRMLRKLFDENFMFITYHEEIDTGLQEIGDFLDDSFNEINCDSQQREDVNFYKEDFRSLRGNGIQLYRNGSSEFLIYRLFYEQLKGLFFSPNDYEQFKLKESNDFERTKLIKYLSEESSRIYYEQLNRVNDNEGLEDSINSLKPKFIYIPILRGMRPLSSADANLDENDFYFRRAARDYFQGNIKLRENEDNIIFTGNKIYSILHNLNNKGKDQRKIKKEFEDYLERHIFHEHVELTADADSDVILIELGDDERHVPHLGDGMQAIILLTFVIYLYKDERAIFLIEEPELNLHPGLQRKFLDVINKPFEGHQFFISTHSNHFLDSVFENDNTNVFSFKKNYEDKKFDVEAITEPKIDLLDNLGVRNSSVFMANCSVWVEGITDRLYIKKYMEVYLLGEGNKEKYGKYNEGQHYTFVEFAGSNITHWDFESTEKLETIDAKKITNRVFLIHDSDYKEVDGEYKIPDNKQIRFNNLENALGDDFCQLECKEIENTLSFKTLQGVVDNYKGGGSLNDDASEEDYSKINIGKFIKDNVTDATKEYVEGNTIKGKKDFCDKAIKQIDSYEDLLGSARELCDKIFLFIERNNKGYV